MIKSAIMMEVNQRSSGMRTLSASTSELRVKKMMRTERVAATLVRQRICVCQRALQRTTFALG
jgi:hypothetical protein